MVFFGRLALIPLFLGVHAEEETCLLQQASQEKMQAAEKNIQAAAALEEATGEKDTLAWRQNYMFDLNIRAGPGVEISGPAFQAGDDSIEGCGFGDRKCNCLYPPNGFQMQGFGTDGAWSGLEFWCRNIKFSMPGHDPSECTCSFKAMINYVGNTRDFVMECSARQCYKLVNYDGQGPGKVDDLYNRFINRGGDGDLSVTSWTFNVEAEALGEARPVQPDGIVGGWQPISAGASTSLKRSITWSSTSTHAELNEVSKSFTEGVTYSYSTEGGINVPGLADAQAKSSLEVSFSATQSWKQAVTDTVSKMSGGSKDFMCTPQACQGGTSYQWQTAVISHQDNLGVLFDSCNFVCMPNQGQRPKCPLGLCCTSDLTDQCSKCSEEWCDKSDPKCPFQNENFKAGC